MSEFTERLRKHQKEALTNPDNFNAISAVLDCLEAAELIDKYEFLEAKRNLGCDVCRNSRYFSNCGVFSRISIHQDRNGNYVMSCGKEFVPVYICPKCGRKLRERNK